MWIVQVILVICDIAGENATTKILLRMISCRCSGNAYIANDDAVLWLMNSWNSLNFWYQNTYIHFYLRRTWVFRKQEKVLWSKAWVVISGIQLLGHCQCFVVYENNLIFYKDSYETINCSLGYYASIIYSLAPKTLYRC